VVFAHVTKKKIVEIAVGSGDDDCDIRCASKNVRDSFVRVAGVQLNMAEEYVEILDA
jgi:hypothetical protein